MKPNPYTGTAEKPVVTMKDWATVGGDTGDPYRAPEFSPPHLRGHVFGHPRKPDGTEVTTSRIVSVQGRRVETRHTIYWIEGPPAAAFVAWCNEHGLPPPTEAEPIRLVLPALPPGEVKSEGWDGQPEFLAALLRQEGGTKP